MKNPCPSQAKKWPRGIGRARRALAVATALSGTFGLAVILPYSASAQTVLITPKGSRLAPSEKPPVFVGADLGQDAPNSLSTPPILRAPTQLAPDAGTTPAVAAADPASAPAPVVPQVVDVAPTPPIVAPVATPVQAVRTRPVVKVAAADADSSDSAADALNSSEYDRLERSQQAVQSRRLQTVSAGDSPRYLDSRAPRVARAEYDVLPEDQRYRPRLRDPQDRYRPPSRLADNSPTPGDDGPLQLPNRAQQSFVDRSTPSESPRSSVYTPSGAVALSDTATIGNGGSGGGYDPVTQEIDRSIAQLRQSLAPSIMGTAEYQGHSGQSGLSKLNKYMTPIEATFSPFGVGQMKLTVTPITMTAGGLGNVVSNYSLFGKMALGVTAPTLVSGVYTPISYTGATPGNQSATGTALDVAYTLGSLTADVGGTPFGFREENLVGGVEWVPELSSTTNLRVTGERRAVSESFLSYGGAVDPSSGKHWGGVVRDSGKFAIETRQGLWNIYGLIGGGYYTGDHVATNNMYEGAVGATYPVFRYKGEELRLGLDLHYTSFYKNLRYFNYGQGGYFSPQRDLALLVPITYHNQVNRDLSYDLRGAVGYQQFGEASSLYFPDDPALQTALQSSKTYSGLQTVYPGQHSSGITGGVSAEVDYRVAPNFSIGAKGGFQQSGVYQEYGGALYAKYIFNGWYNP